MKLIRENCVTCTANNGIDYKYIFIVGATTSATNSSSDPAFLLGRWPTDGINPVGFGIVSSLNCENTQKMNHVITHELGHSLTLEHPINLFNAYSPCNDPLNLMDVKKTNSACEDVEDNKLRKYQWTTIHQNN
jgi:hypothetical protein